MKKIEKIYAYKHDGEVHRMWEGLEELKETKDYYILANKKNNKVYEKENYFWKTKEDAIIYFSKKHWFNIIIMYKENRIVYYCNLATPPILEQKSLKYIDYELDVKYFMDTKDKILLDEKEYEYHKKKYNYSKNLIEKIDIETKQLFEWIEEEIGPFSDDFSKIWNVFKKDVQNEYRRKNN